MRTETTALELPSLSVFLGGVYGPYTGRWFASKSDTDIEHVVARSAAHDSGLCAADLCDPAPLRDDLLNLTLARPG